MTYFEIGVSFWALVTSGLLASAVSAALASTVSNHLGKALGTQVERLREQVHASAAFHEPLSSPSHPSYPPPR